MATWPITKNSGGIDPPTVDDLTSSDTPALIDIYARAWERRGKDSPLEWVAHECKKKAAALFARAERLRTTFDPSMAALAGSVPHVDTYPEAGEDEPTAEHDKPKPPTACYICARAFRPDELVLRLESGAAVCGLCATVMEPDTKGD